MLAGKMWFILLEWYTVLTIHVIVNADSLPQELKQLSSAETSRLINAEDNWNLGGEVSCVYNMP